MKKLKKVLSLLLVAAMVFSFASTALATDLDYVDYDKETSASDETYVAVQAMTNLGVITGNGNDDLQPTENLTRAQAARIITVMMLGTKAANALGATAPAESDYTDVDVNAWYAPYVQFCSDEGVIHGMGDGTFAPDATLTVNQWLVMLLGAIEVDTGKWTNDPQWMNKSAAVALAYNIITPDNYAASADSLTREYAILYAWNALNYSGVKDENGKINPSLAERKFDTSDEVERDIYGDYIRTAWYSGYGVNKYEIASLDIEASMKYEDVEVYLNDFYFMDNSGDEWYYTVIEDGEVNLTYSQEPYNEESVKANKDVVLGGRSSTINVFEEQHTIVIINEQVEPMTADNVKEWDKLYDNADENLVVGDVITYLQGNSMWTTGKEEEVIDPATICNVTPVIDTVAETVPATKDDDEKVLFKSADAENYSYYAKNSLVDNEDFVDATLTGDQKYLVYIDVFGNVIASAKYVAPAADKGTLVFVTQASYKNTVTYDYASFTVTKKVEYYVQYVDLTTGELVEVPYAPEAAEVGKTEDVEGEATEKNSAGFTAIENYAYLSEVDGQNVITYVDQYTSIKSDKTNPYVTIDKELRFSESTQTTRITYTKWFNCDTPAVTTGANNKLDDAAAYVYYELAENGTVAKIYDITMAAETNPDGTKKDNTVYAMYLGEDKKVEQLDKDGKEVVVDGEKQYDQYCSFVTAAGEKVSYIYNGEALTVNGVYLLTVDGSTVTKAEAQTAAKTAAEVILEDKYGINVMTLEKENFSLEKGVANINSKGEAVAVTVAGKDKYGIDYAGSKVDLYTNEKGAVVFIFVNDEEPAE